MDARSPDLTPDSRSKPASGVRSGSAGWRRERGTPSLADMFASVGTARKGPFWRKLLSFLGPGYLVAVGYMDPGNWATSLAGGSKFGYALLSVALLSNAMAIVLQSLCTRLGVGAGRDLAQACRDSFPRWISLPLWLSAELAITATDLAEVIGTAIGLNLLFHIPISIGVILTAADVFLILALQAFGFRWIEAFVVAMLGVIAACFAIQIALADPDWGAVLRGFLPTSDILANREMLYLALGILGATVMPHNLYLHSGLVQTRFIGESGQDKREAIKLATIFHDRAMSCLDHQRLDPDPGGGDLSPDRKDRRCRARSGPCLSRAVARLDAGANVVCDCAALLRIELHHHRDPVGSDRDGGLSELADRAVAAASGDADDRDRAGRGGDAAGRRKGHRPIADLESGGAQPAIAVGGSTTRDVYLEPPQDGFIRCAALAKRIGDSDSGPDHRAQCQAGLGFLGWRALGASA